MQEKLRHVLILLTFLYSTSILSLAKNGSQDTTRWGNINNLEVAIKKILDQTGTPAVGVAIVDSSGPVWVGGLGNANVAEGIEADENTMFRLASVSKMFVALAILKLQEEGKLNLQDKIRDLVPEVEFENPWEGTNPVRIIHLLQHTTGWDELHLVEIAHNDSTTHLLDALAFHPHSRISRWIPGTRNSYTNSGSAVAAFIVEKITGMKYEQYVREKFLLPLKMTNTTYFNDATFQKYGAVGYNTNHEPVPYRHYVYRPVGGMNSSPREMANLVQFFLQRGAIDTIQLVSRRSISEMEIPQGTPGAKSGLQLGYGLCNFTSVHKGFVYQGHGGMLDGALTEFAYLPEQGIGHVIFVNASNGQAFHEISNLIRDFETQSLKSSVEEMEPSFEGTLSLREGFYVPINPRMQGGLFLDYLFGAERIRLTENYISKSRIFPGQAEKFLPVTDSTFRSSGTGKVGMVKSHDPLAGDVLYFERLVMKPISGFFVFGSLSILALSVVLSLLGPLTWLWVLIQSLRRGFNKTFWLCCLVLITSLAYVLVFILTRIGHSDSDNLLAKPGPLSVSIMILSLLILLGPVCSVIIIYMSRDQQKNKVAFWHMGILTSLHILMAIYLLWFGVIPILTWT